jgi:hypothetical protein
MYLRHSTPKRDPRGHLGTPRLAGVPLAPTVRSARMVVLEVEAAQAVIRDLDGRELPLSELWAEKPVVLAFVRHFG